MPSFRNYALLGLVILLTISLPLISHALDGITVVERLPPAINRQLVYQIITLLLSLGFLGGLRLLRKEVLLTYFRKGDLRAKVIPVPALGLKPKPHQSWWHVGRDFALVISLITAVIIYFQLIRGQALSPARLWLVLPFSLLCSLSNSFVEEMLTRLGVVVALKGVASERAIPLVSALIFGGVHYWGSPGGIAGVLAAGFLGWFLAKSILETKGIFWAWLIHFIQDVIILTALFLQE